MWNYSGKRAAMTPDNAGPQKEIRMKSALVAGLVAIAFGAAGSATAWAQANKEAHPSAVTSTSKATALPAGGSAVQGSKASAAPTSPDNTGMAESNGKTSEKARSN
jgi:hypothetical protein